MVPWADDLSIDLSPYGPPTPGDTPPSAAEVPFHQMSRIIKFELSPWQAWAILAGNPCQATGTSTVSLYWNNPVIGGDYSYSGHVDENGKACDVNGTATLPSNYCGGTECVATGGVYDDEFHGLYILKDNNVDNWSDIIEMKHGYFFGKRTGTGSPPAN